MLAAVVAAAGTAAVVLIGPERPPVQFPSPDGRRAVQLSSDTAFGQVETVRVVSHPDTSRARTVFTHRGDVPLRFRRWRNNDIAELEAPARDGATPRFLLFCERDTCRLGPD